MAAGIKCVHRHQYTFKIHALLRSHNVTALRIYGNSIHLCSFADEVIWAILFRGIWGWESRNCDCHAWWCRHITCSCLQVYSRSTWLWSCATSKRRIALSFAVPLQHTHTHYRPTMRTFPVRWWCMSTGHSIMLSSSVNLHKKNQNNATSLRNHAFSSRKCRKNNVTSSHETSTSQRPHWHWTHSQSTGLWPLPHAFNLRTEHQWLGMRRCVPWASVAFWIQDLVSGEAGVLHGAYSTYFIKDTKVNALISDNRWRHARKRRYIHVYKIQIDLISMNKISQRFDCAHHCHRRPHDT